MDQYDLDNTYVWTFVATLHDDGTNYIIDRNCPCTNTRYNWHCQLPSFIQNNYFSDTGKTGHGF